jgi:hypothetical protein
LDKELTKEEEQATFKINQDYSTMVIDSQAVTSLVGVWQSKGIALSDLRAYFRKQGIIATERTDQEIDDDLDAEPPSLGLTNDNGQQ